MLTGTNCTYHPQVVAFIDCQLMNQLLLRPECCSAPNARYVLLGLKKLDSWLVEVGQEEVGDAWGQLQHVREVSCRFYSCSCSSWPYEHVLVDVSCGSRHVANPSHQMSGQCITLSPPLCHASVITTLLLPGT